MDCEKSYKFCTKCWGHNDWFAIKCEHCGSSKLENRIPKDDERKVEDKKKYNK